MNRKFPRRRPWTSGLPPRQALLRRHPGSKSRRRPLRRRGERREREKHLPRFAHLKRVPPTRIAGLTRVVAVLLVLLASVATFAQGVQAIPPLEARITDLTGTLTAQQQASLEEKLADFEARKGAQIVVLIVPTTQPEALEQYSIRVLEAWKLGRKGADDGALLLVAKNDRRLRIDTGYGLEGVMPDAVANRITDETIAPLFKQGDFFGGINAGVEQMIRIIDGESLPEPDHRWRGNEGPSNIFGALPFLLIAVFVASSVLRGIFGRTVGSFLTGGGVGALAFILSKLVGFAVVAGAAAFFFSLFGNLGRGSRWSSNPRHGGWGGGWGGFGGGGFGGGGGGFSGGGGSFGGGGASGSW